MFSYKDDPYVQELEQRVASLEAELKEKEEELKHMTFLYELAQNAF